MNIPKSLRLLDDALARAEMSGYALALRLGGDRFFAYGGTHARAGGQNVAADSAFDLASLTKILVTVALLNKARARQLVDFTLPLQRYLPQFPHAAITIEQILYHQSGLPAHIEFFKRYQAGEAAMGDAAAVFDWICKTPLKADTNTEYSDLGFILLGRLLETLYKKPLAQAFAEEIAAPLKLACSGYAKLHHARDNSHRLSLPSERFVATEHSTWRQKTLQGEVHDDNCWAMGGVAGHAGLFANAGESLQMLDALVADLQAFPYPGPESRAQHGHFRLGFMEYPGLRAHPGQDFAAAIGHTGFTGTSAWHHPANDLSVVLLTNRVHPSRDDARFIATRLEFHHSLWTELGLLSWIP